MLLKIEKLSTDGKGIARTDDGVVFVVGALPGETAEVEIVTRKREYSVAKVKQIIDTSEHRTSPRCPCFFSCGGCQIQHLSYPYQLEAKASFVEESLLRIGKIKTESRIICEASPKIWHYRNKASFPVKNINGKVNLGFYAESSHELVIIDGCAIIHEKLNDTFKIIKDNINNLGITAYDEKLHKGALRHVILRTNGNQVLVSFVINGKINSKQRNNIISLAKSMPDATFTVNENPARGNTILGRKTETINGCGYIEDRIGNHTLRYGTTSFFQVNAEQAENLYKHACSLLPDGGGILELYCGIGSITVSLAEKAERVTAVEEWPEAVDAMKINLDINKISNVTPVCKDAESYISSDVTKYDAALLDPPRGGCGGNVISELISKNIPQIIYISCNPATLARDLKIFTDSGYAIDSIKAFDMFPQTSHVETVVSLVKISKIFKIDECKAAR